MSRFALAAAAFGYLLLSWLLSVSYFTQATGFNDQLFFHLSPNSLAAGWDTVRVLMLSQFSALGALPIAVWWLSGVPSGVTDSQDSHGAVGAEGRKASFAPRTLVFLLSVACLVSLPSRDFIAYLTEHRMALESTRLASSDYTPRAGRPKNIVLIYAESLEATYFDETRFRADLLPSLRHLSEQATVFEDVRQRPGTGWTVAGIISSQCGFSVKVNNPFSGNTRLAATETPYASATCLGDITKRLGYRSLFLGGADTAFAGKGNFLKTHGFDRVLGRAEITALAEEPYELSDWGVHDDDLFEIALREIEQFEASDEPYFLSLLTLDTHHPNGYPSSRCPPFDSEDPMERAIACSDAQIGAFVNALLSRVDRDNTIIAVFSDHLAMRNSLWQQLVDNQAERRLFFMLFDSQAPRRVSTPLTHYDVGATVLEAAAATDVRIGFGRSLALIERSGRPSERVNRALYAEEPSAIDLFRDGLEVDSTQLSISVGDVRFPVSENGGLFVYGVYMLVFDDDGGFLDVLYGRSLDAVRQSVEGRVVAFVERESRGGELRFFVGRLGAEGEEGREYAQFETLSLSADELRSFAD